MTSDGGAVASYGFRRQYLATAEEILRPIVARSDDLDELAVVIDPTRIDLSGSEVTDDDVVDFAIEVGGAIVRRVQVKSSRVPSGMNPLKYSEEAAAPADPDQCMNRPTPTASLERLICQTLRQCNVLHR